MHAIVDAMASLELSGVLAGGCWGSACGRRRFGRLGFGVPSSGSLGGRRVGGRFRYGQRQSPELPAAGDSHAPGQGGTVSSALFPQLDAGPAIWSAAITLDVALSAGKAVLAGTGCGRSPSPLPRGCGRVVSGGRVVDFLGLDFLGGGRGHGHGGRVWQWEGYCRWAQSGMGRWLDSVYSMYSVYSVYSACAKKNKQRYEGQGSMKKGKARVSGYYLAVGSLVLDDKIRVGGHRAVMPPRGCIQNTAARRTLGPEQRSCRRRTGSRLG